jgi:hypothetical protein
MASRPSLNDLNVDDYKVLNKLVQNGGWFEVSPEDCRKIPAVQKIFNGNLITIESTTSNQIKFKAKFELLNWLQGD